MLKVNKSLTYLDLSRNNSTRKNYIISPTFKGLKHNTALLDLDISHATIITDSVAEPCIAQALICNHSLQTLNMHSTCYGDKSICRILDSLMFNTSLKFLCLFRLNQGIEEIVQDFKIVRTNSDLPPIDNHIASS